MVAGAKQPGRTTMQRYQAPQLFRDSVIDTQQPDHIIIEMEPSSSAFAIGAEQPDWVVWGSSG